MICDYCLAKEHCSFTSAWDSAMSFLPDGLISELSDTMSHSFQCDQVELTEEEGEEE